MTKKLLEAIMKRMGIRITARSVTKYIPFLGQGISASISFGAMKIVTNTHINDCYEVAKDLIEMNKTEIIFSNPSKKQTEDYISGRFG